MGPFLMVGNEFVNLAFVRYACLDAACGDVIMYYHPDASGHGTMRVTKEAGAEALWGELTRIADINIQGGENQR